MGWGMSCPQYVTQRTISTRKTNLTLFKGVGDKDSETCKQLSKVTPVNNTRRQTSRAAKRLNILNRWHGIEYDNHFF